MSKNILKAYFIYIIGIFTYLMASFLSNQDYVTLTKIIEWLGLFLCIFTGFYAGISFIFSLGWMSLILGVIMLLIGYILKQPECYAIGLTMISSAGTNVLGISIALAIGASG